jgi:drug/metabolite transporter (DMT)-like permease
VVLGLGAGLLAAVLFGGAAVAQARESRRMAGVESLTSFVRAAVRDPWMLGVVAAYLGGFLLHAVAIWLLPLYLAQAAISLSMPITALIALVALHERLGPVRWAAVALVTLGLTLLAFGSGAPGRVDPSGAYATGLWLGVGLLLVAGLSAGPLGGAWLGALSGVGYTGSAIAVRGLDTPVTGLVVVTALTVPILGLVAFWTYSRALGKAAVTAATGPLIVTQTFLPAVVGVVALDDGVRSWPAAAVGLVLATIATVVLSREG